MSMNEEPKHYYQQEKEPSAKQEITEKIPSSQTGKPDLPGKRLIPSWIEYTLSTVDSSTTDTNTPLNSYSCTDNCLCACLLTEPIPGSRGQLGADITPAEAEEVLTWYEQILII